MAISNFSDLRQAVQDYARRSDQTFVNRIPDFIGLAEQRIYFGGDEPLTTDALRVREMEASADLAFSDAGVATLPGDHVDTRRIYWEADVNLPLTYRSPREFHTSPQQVYNGIPPAIFTTEGLTMLTLPALAGTGKLLYFRRFPALVNDQDTNAILLNYPSVYLQGALLEAFGYARNDPRTQAALTAFAAAVGGANRVAMRARVGGAQLAPRTLPSIRTDRA